MAHSLLPEPGPAGLRGPVRFATLVLTVTLAGCFVVIDPREVVETPSVRGVVLEDGEPVEGASLSIAPVHARGVCEELGQTIRTDARGAFAFTETRVHRTVEFVPLAPSTPGYTVQVCLDTGGGPRPLYRETFSGAPPGHVDLACDLARGTGEGPDCTATLTGRRVPGYRGIL